MSTSCCPDIARRPEAPRLAKTQGDRSFWHVYLRSLPVGYDTLLCWTPQEASALQLPLGIAAAEEARVACATAWRRAMPALLSLEAKAGEGAESATAEAWCVRRGCWLRFAGKPVPPQKPLCCGD